MEKTEKTAQTEGKTAATATSGLTATSGTVQFKSDGLSLSDRIAQREQELKALRDQERQERDEKKKVAKKEREERDGLLKNEGRIVKDVLKTCYEYRKLSKTAKMQFNILDRIKDLVETKPAEPEESAADVDESE